ncbi:hypothetical protein AVEN_198791-1 [Araneus ventricosus]|uniref:Uncharacterized protein n=1 Tax=Araneus ventricosus TaxID=182803 RepID=A0A4Y2VX87_ARAVE|nr:hypothetical protein AVEN_198791-1 [Araneus ventricosus]
MTPAPSQSYKGLSPTGYQSIQPPASYINGHIFFQPTDIRSVMEYSNNNFPKHPVASAQTMHHPRSKEYFLHLPDLICAGTHHVYHREGPKTLFSVHVLPLEALGVIEWKHPDVDRQLLRYEAAVEEYLTKKKKRRGEDDDASNKRNFSEPVIFVEQQPILLEQPFLQSPAQMYPPGTSLDTMVTVEALQQQIIVLNKQIKTLKEEASRRDHQCM